MTYNDEIYNQIIDKTKLSSFPLFTETQKKAVGRKKKWFERIMNKFGWYRGNDFYMVDFGALKGLGMPPVIDKLRDLTLKE